MHGNSKNDQLLVKTVKPLHKYFPATIGTSFSTKFVLEANEENSAF